MFSLGPISDLTSDNDTIHYQIEQRPSLRSENSASIATTTTNDTVNSNPGRTSPVSSKKKGFSRKIFGVFSSRSGSITSASSSSSGVPPNHNNNENTSASSQTPFLPDAVMSLARGSVPLNKENITRQRSIVNKSLNLFYYVLYI